MASLKEQLVAILDKAGYLSQYPGTMARILMENGVEIPVRCKDCNAYDEECGYCEAMGFACKCDDFCSYGERRTND